MQRSWYDGPWEDCPCDDWSGMPIKHQRSLEPDVAWNTPGLDTMWDNGTARAPTPSTGYIGRIYRLLRS